MMLHSNITKLIHFYTTVIFKYQPANLKIKLYENTWNAGYSVETDLHTSIIVQRKLCPIAQGWWIFQSG